MITTNKQKQKNLLNREFTFYLSFYKQLVRSKRINNSVPYASHLTSIASFQTIQDFWAYYQHMIRPEQLPIGCEFFLFENQVMPMWEDTRNSGGGLFKFYMNKSYGNRFWEDLILGIIGEQCELSFNITGICIEVRERECAMSIWVDSDIIDDPAKRDIIREWLKNILGISQQAGGEIVWKKHEQHPEYNQPSRDQAFKKKTFQEQKDQNGKE